MSLFDVIKYPISNPPTHEEMMRVPENVLYRWAKKRTWNAPIDTICKYYAKGDDDIMLDEDYVELDNLRKIIRRLP